MKVCLREGAAWLNVDHFQRLHRAFKGHVRVDGSETAEVARPDQQGGGLAHGSNIQLTEEKQREKKNKNTRVL